MATTLEPDAAARRTARCPTTGCARCCYLLKLAPLLRRADGGALPPGPAARRDLLGPRPGGHARRRRVRPASTRLAVPHAPRPHRAAHEGPRPQPRDGAVLGSDRRLPARPRRQQPHRRLGREPDVRGDVAPADRLPGGGAAPRSRTKRAGDRRVAMAICGDGATSNGRWHEAINTSAIMRLPVVWVVNNNQFAYSTPERARVRGADDRRARAPPTGSPASASTAATCWRSTRPRSEAVERARDGGGPTLIESVSLRWRGHAGHDPAKYVPRELLEHYMLSKDPVKNFEAYLLERRRRRRPTTIDAIAGARRAGVRGGLRVRARLAVPRARRRLQGRVGRGRLLDARAGPRRRDGGRLMATTAGRGRRGRPRRRAARQAHRRRPGHLPDRDRRGPVGGDGARRARLHARRGHRRLRRRVQGHRGLHRPLRADARDGHPDRRGDDRRHGGRLRDGGAPPGRRVPVRRLHVERVRRDHHGAVALPLPQPACRCRSCCAGRAAAACAPRASTRSTPSRGSRTPAASRSCAPRSRRREGPAEVGDPRRQPVLFLEHKWLYRRIKEQVPTIPTSWSRSARPT